MGRRDFHRQYLVPLVPSDGRFAARCQCSTSTKTVSLGVVGPQCYQQKHFTAEFIPESQAHIFYAGAPVWGLDWCPIHPVDRPRWSFATSLFASLSDLKIWIIRTFIQAIPRCCPVPIQHVLTRDRIQSSSAFKGMHSNLVIES